MGSSFKPDELSEFARHYGFHYDNLDPFTLINDVLVDMERGLSGLDSGLPMIPSYIRPIAKLPVNKTVLALDAGGTNLRACLVRFNEHGKAVMQKTVNTVMPGTAGRVNPVQFFDAIAAAALPLLSAAPAIDGIGFTFSYPMDIQPDADGILLAFSKEVDAPEVIGRAIGAGFKEALDRQGFSYSGSVVLLNDTAATLLSGLAAIPETGSAAGSNNACGCPGGPVIGFILGTGFNTAYPEVSIPKINFESHNAPQIVVCETGTFNIRNRGLLDLEFDSYTKNPGTYALEKTLSGAYLGPLTLHILKQAVKDKIICFDKSDELVSISAIDTRTFNEFNLSPLTFEGPLGSLFNKSETDALAAVQYLVSIITERGAMFSAAVLAATVERLYTVSADSIRPHCPVRIAVEGSTYLLYKGMRRSLEAWLHFMLVKNNHRSYVISPVEQASLNGAAVAAVSRLL
jgi:hexokinase